MCFSLEVPLAQRNGGAPGATTAPLEARRTRGWRNQKEAAPAEVDESTATESTETNCSLVSVCRTPRRASSSHTQREAERSPSEESASSTTESGSCPEASPAARCASAARSATASSLSTRERSKRWMAWLASFLSTRSARASSGFS